MLCFLYSKNRSERGLPKKWRGLPRVCPGFAQGFAQGFAHKREVIFRVSRSFVEGFACGLKQILFSFREENQGPTKGVEGVCVGTTGRRGRAQYLGSFNKR